MATITLGLDANRGVAERVLVVLGRLQSPVVLVCIGVIAGAALTAFGPALGIPVPLGTLSAWLHSADLGAWLRAHKDELAPVGPIATGVGVVVASVALLVSVYAQRLSAITGSWNSSRDCLWNFNKDWEKLVDDRKEAWEALRVRPFKDQPAVNGVLNFFESMAFLGNRGHLNDELAWTYYYSDAKDFWTKCEAYVNWAQCKTVDGSLWCEYKGWLHRLDRVEKRMGRRFPAPPPLPGEPDIPATSPAHH